MANKLMHQTEHSNVPDLPVRSVAFLTFLHGKELFWHIAIQDLFNLAIKK